MANENIAAEIAKLIGFNFPAAHVEVIGPLTDITWMLDDALRRKSGHPFFNPRGLTAADFEFHYFKVPNNFFGGSTGMQCYIRCVSTGKTMISSVELWPRSDFWVVLVELSALSR